MSSPYIWHQYQIGDGKRHCMEYSPDLLRTLLHSAGFDDIEIACLDGSVRRSSRIVRTMLSGIGINSEIRGDSMFAIARKAAPVRSRYPHTLYEPYSVKTWEGRTI
jgi:hypothetical protein